MACADLCIYYGVVKWRRPCLLGADLSGRKPNAQYKVLEAGNGDRSKDFFDGGQKSDISIYVDGDFGEI